MHSEISSKNNFPRVLVISPNSFNYLSGSGVTFSNLFKGWPKNHLANLHLWEEPQDTQICGSFYKLSNNELKRFSFAPKKSATVAGQGGGLPNSSLKKKLAGNSGWPESFRMSEKLNVWLKEFNPEIVYTILGPISIMEATLEIRDRFKCKLVVHHMDDWYKDAYTTGLFRYQRKRMLSVFHALVDAADKRFTICDDMAEEYSHRFQNEFIAFQNTVDVEEFRKSVSDHAPNLGHDQRTMLYFGSILSFAQQQSILDTIDAVSSLWKFDHKNAPRFRIVAPKAQLDQLPLSYQKREPVSFVPMENDPCQFEREIAGANALLLPANFGAAAIQSLRFSMPTKLPGYLASGRPVLAYSPPELAQSRHLAKYSAAELVSERSTEKLMKAIQNIMEKERAFELSERAYKVALDCHDSKTVRSQFQQTLRGLGK